MAVKNGSNMPETPRSMSNFSGPDKIGKTPIIIFRHVADHMVVQASKMLSSNPSDHVLG